MALGDFVRRLVITLDRDAAERLRDETAKAVGEAGQEGAQQFAEAMDDGGRRAARELLRALQDEHRRTIAHARIDLARGLIDTSRFREIAAQADRQFNARLIEGMERLRSEGKLTENQFVALANRIKRVDDEGTPAIQNVGGALGRLRGVALRAGAALAGIFALRRIAQFGQETVRAALDAEAVWNRLDGTLRNVGVSFAAVRGELEAAAAELQRTTTLEDEQFVEILQSLVRVTGDYSLALQHVGLVADVAAGAQVGLRTASDLVGRALIGDTALLKRYGIIVTEGANAIDVMRERFGGLAENEARSLSGRVQQLVNVWGDFKEAVGGALIAAGGGTSTLETLIGIVRGMTAFVSENEAAIGKWGRVTLLVFRAAGQTLLTLGRLWKNVWELMGATLALRLLEARRDLDRFLNFVADVVNTAIEGLNRIPFVNIEFRMNQRDPERFAAAIAKAERLARQDTMDMVDALKDLAGAWVDVATAALSSADAQQKASSVQPPPPPPRAGQDRQVPEARDIQPLDTELAGGPRFELLPQPVPSQGEIDAAVERWKNANADIMAASQNAAAGVANAFQDAFELVIREGEGIGGFLEAVFRGVAASALGSLAQYAGGKVAENIAAAFEAHARGLAFAANPFLAPLAAGQFAAAKAHLLAAAKWALLGGLAGAAQGAVAGGGRGGSVGGLPSGAANPADRLLDRATRAQTEVHVYINPLDPSDPVYQRNVMAASQLARERFGDDAVVHVHPFPARRA